MWGTHAMFPCCYSVASTSFIGSKEGTPGAVHSTGAAASLLVMLLGYKSSLVRSVHLFSFRVEDPRFCDGCLISHAGKTASGLCCSFAGWQNACFVWRRSLLSSCKW